MYPLCFVVVSYNLLQGNFLVILLYVLVVYNGISVYIIAQYSITGSFENHYIQLLVTHFIYQTCTNREEIITNVVLKFMPPNVTFEFHLENTTEGMFLSRISL
jgi:hypothetical protein